MIHQSAARRANLSAPMTRPAAALAEHCPRQDGAACTKAGSTPGDRNRLRRARWRIRRPCVGRHTDAHHERVSLGLMRSVLYFLALLALARLPMVSLEQASRDALLPAGYAAPKFNLVLPASTYVASTSPASRRSLGVSSNFALAVYSNSGPHEINITDISMGGWPGTGQSSYTLSFNQAPLPLIAGIEFGATCYNSSACTALLSLHPFRSGATTVNITLRNAAGDHNGTDSYSLEWELNVVKTNGLPSFVKSTASLNVDEDSSCIILATSGLSASAKKTCTVGPDLLHIYPNFMTSITAGLYEDKGAAGCPSTDVFAAINGTCLDQNVTFTLSTAMSSSAVGMFAEFPTLSANGTLRFRLAPDQRGEVLINATITDDGTPAKSWSDVFSIFVLSVNDAPSFNLLPEIVVLEGSNNWSGIVLENITAGCPACTDENDNYCGVADSSSDTACQTVGMDVNYTTPYPGLFTANGLPHLERTSVEQATLSFVIAPGRFGEAYVDVLLYDSGGRLRGGQDTSDTQRLTIRALPINDPPSFSLTTNLITVEENSGALRPLQVATDITAGMNEDCEEGQVATWCEAQGVTFVIEHVEGAELFSRPPAVNAAGNLSFTVYPGVTGVSRVYIRLEDDGDVGSGSQGNVSTTEQFSIVVTPVEYQANFFLGRKVSCLQLSHVQPGQCTCPRLTQGQKSVDVCAGELAPGEVSQVRVIEDSGPVVIEAFATHITNAAGYLPGSLSVFTLNESTGLLRFEEQREDAVAGAWGMEYAADHRVSSDSRHLYAVEAETDSLSVFDLSQESAVGGALRRAFRIRDDERQFVFRGFNISNIYDRTPFTVASQELSSLSVFVDDDAMFVLAAQGGDPVRNDVRRRKERPKHLSASEATAAAAATVEKTRYQSFHEPDNLWDKTLACWVFDLHSVFAPPGIDERELQARFNVDPADFVDESAVMFGTTSSKMNLKFDDTVREENRRVSDVRCGRNGCSFARNTTRIDRDWCPSPGRVIPTTPSAACSKDCRSGNCEAFNCTCNERFPTLVQYASVRDLTNRAGPLLLTGPQCKVMSSCQEDSGHCSTRGRYSWAQVANDWDVERDQLDLRTFIFGDSEMQAMQFDDNLNTGMFLSFDMKKVVNLMPKRDFSVEIWFTIDADPQPDDVDNNGDGVIDESDRDVDDDPCTEVSPRNDEFTNMPVRRALVGVEAFLDVDNPDQFFCKRGWSLSYTHQISKTTLRFFVGVQNMKIGDRPLEVQVSPRIPQGVWQHLVATYDGSKFNTIYLNGVQLPNGQGAACTDDSFDGTGTCGDVQYPGIKAESDNSIALKCTLKPYNFSVGAWKNGEDELKHYKDFQNQFTNNDYFSMGKHRGAIHMVRIYDVKLNASDVYRQYDQLRVKMANHSLAKPVRAWTAQQQAGKNSPSIDFAHAAAPQLVTVHGYFDVFAEHRCEWHAEAPQAGTVDEVAYTPANATESTSEGYLGNTLSCYSAVWPHGMRFTRFHISALGRDGEWRRLYMKVCLDEECGFVGQQNKTGGGRDSMYFATHNSINSPDGVSVRYTLRSTANAVPKEFRYVQSSGAYKMSMTEPHQKGSVNELQPVYAGAANLVNGTVRILSSNAGSNGRFFNASFTATANGTAGNITIVDHGFGYPQDGGNATICHLNSYEPMTGTVTMASVEAVGTGYVDGTWEAVSGQYGSALVQCLVSPKGSITASPIVDGYGGELLSVSIDATGNSCNSEIVPESVVFYYPGTNRVKQEGSISKIAGISETLVGTLTEEGTATPISNQVPETVDGVALTELDAFAHVPSYNCTGRPTCGKGKNFLGKCQLKWEGGMAQVVGIRIVNPGEGYSIDYPPTEIRCTYGTNSFSIFGITLYIRIPNGAALSLRVARVDPVPYTTIGRGFLALSEPGLAGGQWGGIWGVQTGESARPLWPSLSALTPIQVQTSNGLTTFVLASNYWDGLTGNRIVLTAQGYQLVDHEMSYLLLWTNASHGLACVQAVNTSGAVSFHHFEMQHAHYVVAANFREVLPNGETTTVARSAIYRLNASNPAGDVPTAPYIGGQVAPEKCSTDSPLGRAPMWTADATRFRTAGAVAIDSFVMNHSTRFGQVRLMVVANYYNSDDRSSAGLSKLYILGKPQNHTHSFFGANKYHLWPRCSDSQAPCEGEAQCHIHKCDQGCVVTRRPGEEPSIQCVCSNRPLQTCSVDAECNVGIECRPQNVPVPLEDHSKCMQGGMVEFEGTSREGHLALCELQVFNVEAAHAVAHLQSDAVHVIVFAADSPSALSTVFVSKDGAQAFVQIQTLQTQYATRLHVMHPRKVQRPFLLVAQGHESILYAWNGTKLNPKQYMGEARGESIAAAAYVEYGDLMYTVFGGGHSRLYNSLSLLQGFEKLTPGLDAPGALELSPDGMHLYVISQRSRMLAHFGRDPATGELELQDASMYSYADGITGTPKNITPWGSAVTQQAMTTIYEWNRSVQVKTSSPLPPSSQPEAYRTGPSVMGQYGYPARGVVSLLMAEDGRFLYAASYGDSAIHIWSRDPGTGRLAWKSTFSDPREDVDLRRGRIGLGPGGYFMRGPRALALGSAAGSNHTLLVACGTSKSVVLLDRNATTGELSFVDAARDGERDILSFAASAPEAGANARPFPTRIGGTRGAGAGNTRQDQEHAWARTVQAVKPFVIKGRQMLAVASSDSSPDADGAAIILEWRADLEGPNANYGHFATIQTLEGDSTAIDIEYFEIEVSGGDTDEYLVVANGYGATRVYLWDESEFVLHHTLPMARLAFDDKGCSCLCNEPSSNTTSASSVNNSANRTYVCGTCFDDPVLRQSQHSACGVGADSAATRICQAREVVLLPRAIRHFFVQESREHFLAVAYWSSDSRYLADSQEGGHDCRQVYSHIYRWNEDNPRRLASGRVVWGHGFEVYHPIATAGAIGVEHVAVKHDVLGQISLVGVAEFVGASTAPTVRMLRYIRYAFNAFLRTSAGSFQHFQVLPVKAAFALHAFSIDREGTFLVVAARQNAPAPTVDSHTGAGRSAFLTVHDADSVLLKWNGSAFTVHQVLRGDGHMNFSSVAAPARAFDIHGNFTARDVNCTLSPSALGCPSLAGAEWSMAEGLRGATSMYSFTDVDGEVYLAVAQSVCDPGVPNRQCNHTAHPMSSILQWDRVHKRFTEMLAYTDESFRQRFGGAEVRDQDIRMHQAALRIPTGRARRFGSFVVGRGKWGASANWPGVADKGRASGRITLLIAASADEGALVYEFGFTQVVGLAGAAAVAVSPKGGFAYVAAEDDSAITTFVLKQQVDVTQRKVSRLSQIQALSEGVLEGGDRIRVPISHGLRGIRHLQYSNMTDCRGYTGIASGQQRCPTVLLRGGVPRTQLPCGELPPVQQCPDAGAGTGSPTPHLCRPSVDPLEPRAMCRDISFRTEEVAQPRSNARLFADDGMPKLVDRGPLAGTLRFTPRAGETGTARFRVVMEKAASSSMPASPASQPVAREFVIEVVPVNDPPVIGQTRDITVLAAGGRVDEVFSSHIVSDAVTSADIRNFTWQWDVVNSSRREPFACSVEDLTLRAAAEARQNVNCSTYKNASYWPPAPPSLSTVSGQFFSTTPSFSFRRTEDGVLEGVISFEPRPTSSGQVRLFSRIHDGTVENPATGSSPTSEEISFLITILPANFAPSFTALNASFVLVEGQNSTVQAHFATNISPGMMAFEKEQRVSFSLSHIEPIHVLGWNLSNTSDIVSQFGIDQNGTLTFRMAENFAGDVRMVIRLSDDTRGTYGGTHFSLTAVNVSVAPINDRPRLKDNGAELHKCEWGNVTYQIALHESSYLFPLLSKNLACRFRDGFCGYTDLTTVNETQGATIPWSRADRRIQAIQKVTSNGIDQYRGSGPEYGQEAANCQGWPDTPLILRSAEEMNDPEFPDGELWCEPEYYVAADAWRGVDPPPAGCVFCAGEYGLLMTEPVGVYAAGVIDTHVPGGSQRMLRSEAAIELVYGFYYHMWDGDPSWRTVKSYHEDMGSLELQARSGVGGNWTTVWKRQGAQTDYHTWVHGRVALSGEFLQSGLQLRFRAQRFTNPYSIMAVDSISVNASVLRDDRTYRCGMQLVITGVFVDAVRTLEHALQIEQPPDEMATQTLTFSLTVVSGQELFFDQPTADANGTLVLPLARAGRGTAVISAVVHDDGPCLQAATNDSDLVGPGHQCKSLPFVFEVIVDGFEQLPSFILQPTLAVVDGAGLENFPHFATVETLATLAKESLAFIRFSVSCTSTAPGMWVHPPSIDPLGTLSLEVRTGFSGQAYCRVQLGGADGSVSDSLSPPQYFSVKIWPRPQVTAVSPAMANPFATTLVTVLGRNFGSLLSRGYSATTYGNVSVYISTPYTYSLKGVKHSSVKWEACVDGATFVSDENLLCTIPPGAGMRHIKVEIMEHGINRTGVLQQALTGVELWVGGTAADPHCQAFGAPWPHRQEAIAHCGQRGFLASGPGPLFQPPKFDMARLNVSSAVRSLVVSGSTVFMGGSFNNVNSTRANGIAAFDRLSVSSLALGLDGGVNSLGLVHRGRHLLVAGGSFTRAHHASGSIRTGGLALWDQTSRQWGALAGVPLQGVCLALVVKGNKIFVGGRFSGAGNVEAANIAVFQTGVAAQGIILDPMGFARADGIAGSDGGVWKALGEGIDGIVYALAAGQTSEIYAGGNFLLAGGVHVENIARWESIDGEIGGGYWTGLVDTDCLRLKSGVCGVDGEVWALAFVGEHLYVGGSFSFAGGKPARNIARYISGVWEGVGGGVNGPIHTLTAIRLHGTFAGSCIYVAGDFKEVKDKRGTMDASGLVRWCIGDPGTVLKVDEQRSEAGVTSEYWEQVDLPEGILSVRAIAVYN